MIDAVSTVRAIVLSHVGVTGLIAQRMWGEYMPAPEVALMPRKSVRLLVDAGPSTPGLPYVNCMARFHCYGATAIEAWEVARAIYDALVRQGEETIAVGGANVLFYMSNDESWGSYVPEPETDWPRVVASYSFALSEAPV